MEKKPWGLVEEEEKEKGKKPTEEELKEIVKLLEKEKEEGKKSDVKEVL